MNTNITENILRILRGQSVELGFDWGVGICVFVPVFFVFYLSNLYDKACHDGVLNRVLSYVVVLASILLSVGHALLA